jgi:hypothetical protein
MSVNELNKLKSLVHLQFLKNPLNDSDKGTTIIQWFFAKLEKLVVLNRYVLDKFNTEKTGAEFDYMRKFYKDYLKAHQSENSTESDKLTFNREHPRYLQYLESN